MLKNVDSVAVGFGVALSHPALERWNLDIEDIDADDVTVHTVPSERDSDVSYLIVHINDHWGCSCDDFIHRRLDDDPARTGTCKHIRSIRRDKQATDDEQVSITDL